MLSGSSLLPLANLWLDTASTFPASSELTYVRTKKHVECWIIGIGYEVSMKVKYIQISEMKIRLLCKLSRHQTTNEGTKTSQCFSQFYRNVCLFKPSATDVDLEVRHITFKTLYCLNLSLMCGP